MVLQEINTVIFKNIVQTLEEEENLSAQEKLRRNMVTKRINKSQIFTTCPL